MAGRNLGHRRRVVARRLDFPPMADDARLFQERFQILVRDRRHAFRFESKKISSKSGHLPSTMLCVSPEENTRSDIIDK